MKVQVSMDFSLRAQVPASNTRGARDYLSVMVWIGFNHALTTNGCMRIKGPKNPLLYHPEVFGQSDLA